MRSDAVLGLMAGAVLVSAVTGCEVVAGLGDPSPYAPDAGAGGTGGSCSDGARNGGETGLDCGGSACPPCDDGEKCEEGRDCESRVCNDGECIAPSCTDGVNNGDETGADCGGEACAACPDGGPCSVAADCASGVCKGDVCVDYLVWAKGFPHSGIQNLSGVASDERGVTIVGTFDGATDFGAGAVSSAGLRDMFVTKLDGGGNLQWTRRFGDGSEQSSPDLAIDASGNTILGGALTGSVDFGGGPLVSSSEDVFIVKLDPNGSHLWSRKFGGASVQNARDVSVDAGGNVLVTGSFTGTVDFGGGALPNGGQFDSFVAKFSPSGDHLWSKRFGSVGDDFGRQIVADHQGNVYAWGTFVGSVSFGGATLTSASDTDSYLVKLDPAGMHMWSKRFGDVMGDGIEARMTIDPDGNIVFAGQFYQVVDFGGGPLSSLGTYDYFVAQLDPMGAHLWSKQFGDADSYGSLDVSVDVNGNILLGGGLSNGTVDFGCGVLVSAGDGDVVAAKLDSAGNCLWSRRFDDTGQEYAKYIAAHGSEDAFVAGFFRGGIDLGGGPITGDLVSNIFLARFLLP